MRFVPLMKLALSDAKNNTESAISSAFPILPIGFFDICILNRSGMAFSAPPLKLSN